MNIVKEIEKRNLQYVNANLNNVEEIHKAYMEDLKMNGANVSPYFWAQFLPLILNMMLFFVIVCIFVFYVKSYVFLFGMAILSIYIAHKDFLGLEKILLTKIIKLILMKDGYAYLELLSSYNLQKPVDDDIYDEILNTYNKDDLIKLSINGKIRNISVLQMNQ
jgi:hypothetical protein